MSNSVRILACCLTLLLGACSLSRGDDADQPPAPLKLTVSGPVSAAPGAATTGFTAKLMRGDEPVPETFVTLTASSGTIDAPPDRPATTGTETDASGEIAFTVHAPSDVTQPTTITITANVDLDGETVQGSYAVGVTPDVFQFIGPASGAATPVGQSNALPLKFQWTHATDDGTAGVAGTLILTAANGAYFVVQGTALPVGQSATVNTKADSAGDFSTGIAIASNTGGQVTVTATDSSASSRTAQVAVQFTEAASALILDADTLTVQASPSASRFSTLTATVFNERNQKMSGANVRFTLKTAVSASVNERVSPQTGSTGADGTVVSKYEAGPASGTATVEACVSDTEICDSRDIEVQGSSDEETP